jgi:hypothetical protein
MTRSTTLSNRARQTPSRAPLVNSNYTCIVSTRHTHTHRPVERIGVFFAEARVGEQWVLAAANSVRAIHNRTAAAAAFNVDEILQPHLERLREQAAHCFCCRRTI